jgi:hypothetical protein
VPTFAIEYLPQFKRFKDPVTAELLHKKYWRMQEELKELESQINKLPINGSCGQPLCEPGSCGHNGNP